MINDEIFWWRDAAPASPPQTPVAPGCDVAIIGAGYTGLSAALTLAKAGRSVQVFDREVPGFGASSRNGGITSGNVRHSGASAVRALGRDRASALFREGVAARQFLARLVTENAIDCDYRMTGRFTGAIVQPDLEDMKREADLLHDLAGIEMQVVEGARLPDVVGSAVYLGGALRPDIGTIHPAKLLNGLLDAAWRAGAVVHGQTPVQTAQPQGDGYQVRTARGTVQTGEVIFATNGYTDQVNPWLRRRIVPVTSRIIVTEELSENLVQSLIPGGRAMGEKRRLYRYFRPTPDGKRILLGTREPVTGDPVRHIHSELAAIFPALKDAQIAASWGGKVAFSRQEIPHLFRVNGMHYAVGYCGSGTVWAPWLGHHAAMNILDPTHPKSVLDTSPPPAIPLYTGKPWFLPLAIAWHGLRDRWDGK